jgi:hypothetical protein
LVPRRQLTFCHFSPANNQLKATPPEKAGPQTRSLVEKWGRLHAVRTSLGVAATLAYLWALN